MGLLKKLGSLRSGGSGDDQYVHYEYARCSRCGDTVRMRVDKRNELTPRYEGDQSGFYVRKGVLGADKSRCFQTLEVELEFTSEMQLASRSISGGEFITEEEYNTEHQESGQEP